MRYVLITILGWACTALLLSGCSSGNGAVPEGDTGQPATQELSWPPPAAPARNVSTSLCQIAGSEYTLASGFCIRENDDLMMCGNNELPWAIYSVGALDEDNELSKVFCTFDEIPVEDGDGTEVYFGLANYQTESWEWIAQPTPTEPWEPDALKARDYRSPEGDAHVVVVVYGPGSARISSVSFLSTGNFNYVTKPQNLTGVCETAREVRLDWDAVEGADGYNIYRSRNAEFDGRIKLNGEPVTEITYNDVIDTNGEYFFYYVTAVGDNESLPSNSVQVWCFGIDLPAPDNLEVLHRAAESFQGGWEWGEPGDSPMSFTLFLDTQPCFTLESETMLQVNIFGSQRQNTFYDIEPGVIYYWKLCASVSYNGPHGRMSDEVVGTSKGFWEWDEVDVIGPGQTPARIVGADGNVAISYFGDNCVNFGYKDGDEWKIQTPFELSEEVFLEYQDLSYGGGCYLLAAQASYPGDCWASTYMYYGEPGNWSSVRVHGDGIASLTSPKSGFYVATAAGENELSILHYDLTRRELVLHSKLIEDTEWTTEIIRDDFVPGCTPSISACYLDDDLYVLSTHNYIDALLLGNRGSDWNWHEIRDEDAPKLAYCHDLNRFRDEWWTPALQSREKDLHLLHGNSQPWEDEVLNYWFEQAGYYTRFAVEGDEAVLITYAHERYRYAIYSENWKLGPIDVPGVSDYSFFGDVALIDGHPYVIFMDNDSGNIMVVKGNPPED